MNKLISADIRDALGAAGFSWARGRDRSGLSRWGYVEAGTGAFIDFLTLREATAADLSRLVHEARRAAERG